MEEEPGQDDLAGRILVVDDDPAIREILITLLSSAGYRIESCGLASEALDALRNSPPDLVLLDLDLPDRNGHEVLEEIRSNPSTRLLPVVMLTGQATKERKLRAIREGVTDFLSKPFSPEELVPRVRSLITMKHFADEHEHTERVILTLAKTIDARDSYTAGHSGRVAEYADRIAARIGVDPSARIDMRRGALFHDLGKIIIPDAILKKPGPLTLEERKVVEQHPVAGYELLSPMRTMRKTLAIVSQHHERLDGSGYPEGISGDAISLPVRIVTVADVFDAITSDRSFRPAMRLEMAYDVLAEGVRKLWWDAVAFDSLRAAVDELGLIGSQSPV